MLLFLFRDASEIHIYAIPFFMLYLEILQSRRFLLAYTREVLSQENARSISSILIYIPTPNREEPRRRPGAEEMEFLMRCGEQV